MSAARQLEAPLLTGAERAAFLERVRGGVSPQDFVLIAAMSEALPRVVAMVEQEHMTMRKLRHLLFGAKSEQTDRVCPPPAAPRSPPPTPRRRPGHGRIKARDYTGARWVQVSHPDLKAGQVCPQCGKGRLRTQSRPAIVLRIEASPPIAATGYELERLRCDACGTLFTAPAPAEADSEKYAPSVAVTIALLRYGTGLPHSRLARLQHSLGVPLPESTQWELLVPFTRQAQPVFAALLALAADASVIHHDDTNMRILDLRRPRSSTVTLMDPKRTGTFTTSIVAAVQGHIVALYFTGWQHAGENLADVLRQRAADLAPPIQMCDALSRNTRGELNTLLAHCLAHGRREFVSVAPNFPEECRTVLEALGEVYRFDAEAGQRQLDPQARLRHHQLHSEPVMARLKAWMQEKLDHKQVEPNSGLGQAIGYMLKHWEPLTLFLRQPGAPLDNNICERALKMAILHRKNSLSYKTLNGARTGDLFMSLIHTCRLNEINPFAYLLSLATHAEQVKTRPHDWLPWRYPPAATAASHDADPPRHPG
jgi:transposase